jgi:hypothetical protein
LRPGQWRNTLTLTQLHSRSGAVVTWSIHPARRNVKCRKPPLPRDVGLPETVRDWFIRGASWMSNVNVFICAQPQLLRWNFSITVFFYLQPGSTELADNVKRIIFLQIFYDEWSISDGESMAAVKLLSDEEKFSWLQKKTGTVFYIFTIFS